MELARRQIKQNGLTVSPGDPRQSIEETEQNPSRTQTQTAAREAGGPALREDASDVRPGRQSSVRAVAAAVL